MVSRGREKSKVNLKEKMESFERKCRKAGLKVTPQRSVVYKVLVRYEEHPSTEMVYRRARKILPNISLDTVNRTLLTLSEIGAALWLRVLVTRSVLTVIWRTIGILSASSVKELLIFTIKVLRI